MLIIGNKLNREMGVWRYFLHIWEKLVKTTAMLPFTQEPFLNANGSCSLDYSE